MDIDNMTPSECLEAYRDMTLELAPLLKTLDQLKAKIKIHILNIANHAPCLIPFAIFMRLNNKTANAIVNIILV